MSGTGRIGRGGAAAGDPPGSCRLCGGPVVEMPPAHGRRFESCRHCGLVAARLSELPTREAERARYDTHENRVDDPGYRSFLSPAAEAVTTRLQPGARGLDYGAGPGPALAAMLTESGYPTDVYDPFYHPDPTPLERRWDFVVCTETAEHFHRPGAEFARLAGLLDGAGSHLVVMTQVLEPEVDFTTWWYARDPTHVAFYRPATLSWIARAHGWRLSRPHPNVAVFSPRTTRTAALHRTEFVAWVSAGFLGAFALAGAIQAVRGRPEGWFVFGFLGIFALPAFMAALVARERSRQGREGGSRDPDGEAPAAAEAGHPLEEDA